MSRTFTDPNLIIEDCTDSIDVRCPKCSAHTKVVRSENQPYSVRFVCGNCGSSRKWKGSVSIVSFSSTAPDDQTICYGGPFDPFFHYSLYFQTDSCGSVLWAYNHPHLEFLRDYVYATHRVANPKFGGNRTLASRLPRWMISGKNRKAVLKSLSFLTDQAQQVGAGNPLPAE